MPILPHGVDIALLWSGALEVMQRSGMELLRMKLQLFSSTSFWEQLPCLPLPSPPATDQWFRCQLSSACCTLVHVAWEWSCYVARGESADHPSLKCPLITACSEHPVLSSLLMGLRATVMHATCSNRLAGRLSSGCPLTANPTMARHRHSISEECNWLVTSGGVAGWMCLSVALPTMPSLPPFLRGK